MLPTGPSPASHQLVVNAVINMVINQSLKESSISQQQVVKEPSIRRQIEYFLVEIVETLICLSIDGSHRVVWLAGKRRRVLMECRSVLTAR